MRPSADCQTTFFRRFKQIRNILKKVAERSRDCQTTFIHVSSNLEFFWKKSLNGHATVVGVHATVGRLSNNVHTRFKQFGNFLKKVTERSRNSGRSSRDRRPTVKQRFYGRFKHFENSYWTVTRQRSEITQPSIDFFLFTFRTCNSRATRRYKLCLCSVVIVSEI